MKISSTSSALKVLFLFASALEIAQAAQGHLSPIGNNLPVIRKHRKVAAASSQTAMIFVPP
jgi:hypothetical protein